MGVGERALFCCGDGGGRVVLWGLRRESCFVRWRRGICFVVGGGDGGECCFVGVEKRDCSL